MRDEASLRKYPNHPAKVDITSHTTQWRKPHPPLHCYQSVATSPKIIQVHCLLLVRQLGIFLDIHSTLVSELMKFPYLLLKNHPFTMLIISDCHIKQCHPGTNSTITAIRQTYWIPAVRHYIRKVINNSV